MSSYAASGATRFTVDRTTGGIVPSSSRCSPAWTRRVSKAGIGHLRAAHKRRPPGTPRGLFLRSEQTGSEVELQSAGGLARERGRRIRGHLVQVADHPALEVEGGALPD